MSFSFRIQGSFYRVISEMKEVELMAREESTEVSINRMHLLESKPYIVVTCPDEEKGKTLLKRLEREAPRFLPMEK